MQLHHKSKIYNPIQLSSEAGLHEEQTQIKVIIHLIISYALAFMIEVQTIL